MELNTIENQQKRYVIYTPAGRIFTDNPYYCVSMNKLYGYVWQKNPNYKPK